MPQRENLYTLGIAIFLGKDAFSAIGDQFMGDRDTSLYRQFMTQLEMKSKGKRSALNRTSRLSDRVSLERGELTLLHSGFKIATEKAF